MNTLEKDASDALTTALLSDFLFGAEDGKDLPESLDDMKRFKELLSWSGQQWADLLRKSGKCSSSDTGITGLTSI